LVKDINLFERQATGLCAVYCIGLAVDALVGDVPETRSLTSGMQKYVKIMQQKHVEPHMKNTRASSPAEPGSSLTRYGAKG
jgi:hypothetical protein